MLVLVGIFLAFEVILFVSLSLLSLLPQDDETPALVAKRKPEQTYSSRDYELEYQPGAQAYTPAHSGD